MQQNFTCPYCGAQVPYLQPFCGNCGQSLYWPDQQVPPPSYEDQQQEQEWEQQQWTSEQQAQQPGWDQGYYDQSQQWVSQPQHRVSGTGRRRTRPKKGGAGGIIAMGVVLCILLIGGGLFFATEGEIFSGLFGKHEVEPTTTGIPTPQVTFSANPASIVEGDISNLSWNAIGADSVSIDHDVGSVATEGEQSVTPAVTTTYTLTATNASGSVTKQVKVTVTPPGVPEIVSFTASNSTINSGETTTLRWEVTGATTISIDNDIGEVSATGSKSVSPISTITYTLTATNTGGSKTATATVTLASSSVPVINSFTADPTSINSGGNSTLQWNVTGATSLSIDHNIGPITPVTSGSKAVTPTATITYTLTATNSKGSVNATATITITQAGLPVIISFDAVPISVNAGGSSTLQWNIVGATSISINQDIGAITPITTTTKSVAPGTTKTYTITATNSTGSASRSVTVTVAIAGSPVVNSFTTNPANIGSGGISTLTWSTTNATSVAIDHGLGIVASSGSLQVNPTTTTTYSLTATNATGPITLPATVTVDANMQFYAQPSTIIAGQSGGARLIWRALGASSVIIDQGIGQVNADDHMDVYPDTTTTYTLTADSIVLATTVTVNSASAPVIRSFTASPVSGDTVTLSWDIANNATSATISPGIGALQSTTTGTKVVPIAQTTSFTIAAQNSYGTVYKSVTVTVQ